jgi:hypothetical protein
MASRRLFDGAQIELGLLPIVGVGGGSYTLSADGGIYSYSGNNATLTYTPTGSYSLAADGTAYSYSGNHATLLYNRRLVADGAVYSYSGNDASLIYTPAGAFTLSADGGTYSYTGNNANLLLNRRLIADGATYTYSGNNADLTYVPFSGAYTIIADGGVYSYSGNNANFLYTGQQPDAVGGGNPRSYKREYQPTTYELIERRKIEREFEEAQLKLKTTENKIKTLEVKRARDLADEAMQVELLGLLTQQNELMQLIKELQQQKLRIINDDDEVMLLLMRLIN